MSGNNSKSWPAWESVNGPVKPGYVIHHINQNHDDNRIENLLMMTNEDHCVMHHIAKRNDDFRAIMVWLKVLA